MFADDCSPGSRRVRRACSRRRSLRSRTRRRPSRSRSTFRSRVGGPITKLDRRLRRRFREGEPGIKVKPIYSGTYQDTITKALTAVKGGEPPVTSILLSTDMFTLIDEDAIVPFDDFIKTPDDQAWLKSFYPAFMENSQTGGKTWGIPFQRSTIVLYWNKEMFKEAGLDPNQRAGQLEGDGRLRAEAHQARCVGQGHAVGRADSVVGLPVLAVPGRSRSRTAST